MLINLPPEGDQKSPSLRSGLWTDLRSDVNKYLSNQIKPTSGPRPSAIDKGRPRATLNATSRFGSGEIFLQIFPDPSSQTQGIPKETTGKGWKNNGKLTGSISEMISCVYM
jgi:hypothetical protein